MAKVSFNNLDDESLNTNQGNGSDVGFFNLKNDNDEAIVRFICDSVDDMEILTVHDVKVGERYRKVNCIRDPREPLDNCPLCKSGARISNRFFIKMIQYDQVPDAASGVTRVVPKAMIWERSTSYAKTLKSYLDNYGPLSDVICKVIRHGKAGDMQTTYEIVPNLSKVAFRDDVFVKDLSLFGDFQAFGTIVMDRTFDEINTFLATGSFPQRQKADANAQPQVNAQPAPQATPAAPTYNAAPEITPRTYEAPAQPQYNAPAAAPQYNAAPAPQYNAPTAAPAGFGSAPTTGGNPWDAPQTGGFDRPRRY